MPDKFKMSLQNGLVIAGVILSVGISYSAINGRVEAQENINLAQSVDIKDNEDGISSLALQNTRIEAMLGAIIRSIEKGDKLTEDRFNRIFDILSTFEVTN